VVDGAVNADIFEAFVEQVLVPELRPGDVVVMDNLSSHKRAKIPDLLTYPPRAKRLTERLGAPFPQS